MRSKTKAHVQEIVTWWSQRISNGCQLGNIDYFQERLDYRREDDLRDLRWFAEVESSALFRDYALSGGSAGEHQFLSWASRLIAPKAIKTRLVNTRNRGPDVAGLRGTRRFWAFHSVEEHTQILTVKLRSIYLD